MTSFRAKAHKQLNECDNKLLLKMLLSLQHEIMITVESRSYRKPPPDDLDLYLVKGHLARLHMWKARHRTLLFQEAIK